MQKNVLITVTGLLYTGSGEDEKDYIDVITPGRYYWRGDRHYLLYEEQVEGCDAPIRNQVSLGPDRVEIHKTGVISTQMRFEPKKETATWYSTPFGRMDLMIYTNRITIQESEEKVEANIRYKLYIGREQVNDCFVHILVQPQREDGGFHLTERGTGGRPEKEEA